MRIKICGITRVIDAERAADLGADAIGLNFWPRSKRFVSSVTQARAIVQALPPFVWAVGVFVNARRSEIDQLVSRVGLHAIQLHGDEGVADTRGHAVPVFKAVHIGQSLRRFGSVPFVLDAQQPGYGGGGITLDWKRSRRIARDHRVLLAGGLTPKNVGEAIEVVQPYGVDVASGVESSPRIKSKQLMKQFIEAARSTTR